ncbi:efflux transporter outer membrane subunit [Mesorhizobium sp. AR10]|uniref:efflux transporter outer membrane subunit n=1 Tax=Mesorhizobium sp. AR10 TaxID=2865839 RepID=UPI00215F32F1|nr:efflux transporter outer membrane subunit [Mesorhizobium sp. AR10]UVK40717.1 efflux transporter outer membrane subunit [Mesorhizobium sp. AR10]
MGHELRTITAISFTFALASCTVGPDFVQPDPSLPNRWFANGSAAATVRSAGSATVHEPVVPAWWQAFHDATLTSLVRRLADANLDVQTATVRLAESRFQRGAVASAQLPGLNGSARYQHQNLSDVSAKGTLIDGLLGSPNSTISSTKPSDLFTSGFDASWELDLWGHVRRQVEGADAQVQSSEEQRRDALLSSLAETARDYIQLRGTQTLIRITNDNLKIERDILQLTQTRQQQGLTTSVDVENAAAQVEAVRAQLPSLEQQEAQQINALSFLLGLPPDALRVELATGKQVVPRPARVPIGIPSELARRRPDIRAAEARLHAATADIGVAVAEFYPSIQLNGSVGFDALKVASQLTAHAIPTSFGPSISIPIFEGGRLKATLQLRKAQQVEAAIAYHRTVLEAWHEVVNSLVAYRTERQRSARLASQVEHLRQALSLARDRYNDGVTEFTTVLDTSRTLLQAEQDHAQSTTNISINLVQLYKALGGGWELTYPSARPEPPVIARGPSRARKPT